MSAASKPKLMLESLHERHVGLTASLGESFVEAASVCFSRHHASPVELEIVCFERSAYREVDFVKPNQQILNAYANEIDTTESGAYGVSLAAVEAEEQLVAVRRAETLTGADWYVAPIGAIADDLEQCFRLEVSGVNAGSRSAIETRLRQKVKQTRQGNSNLPAIAAVVGFKERTVVIEKVSEES